ncbi:MAG: hypothetical protein C4326_08670 [Ignavibacteria bacterium]
MKTSVSIVLFLTLSLSTFRFALAQEDGDVISQRGVLQVAPLFQRWSLDSSTVSQSSAVLYVYQPLSRSASVSLRGSFGSTSGDVTTLSGLSDVQLAGNYYFESANLVFALGVGIPSGKKQLPFSQFRTSAVIAENIFRFQMPNFGSGFNLSPSVMWALPVGEDVVFGLGAGFQYRGEYKPIENGGTLKPGNEFLGTVGVEIRTSETSSIALDVVYTRYGRDKLNGSEVFASGDRVRATAQFKASFERNELLVVGSFRSKGKAEAGFGGTFTPLQQRLTPNQGEVLAAYRASFSDRFATQFILEGRFFEKTFAFFSGYSIIGIGAVPEIVLATDVVMPLRLRYFYGTKEGGQALKGIEAGLGLIVRY